MKNVDFKIFQTLTIIIFVILLGYYLSKAWDQRWSQDDSYISFRYAKNLVNGIGLTWNKGDEKVEGYTNFSWTLLSAIPLLAGAEDPSTFMHCVGIILLFLTIVIFILIFIFLFGKDYLWSIFGILPLFLFDSFHLWYVGGMETGLVAFLITMLLALSLYVYHHPVSRNFILLTVCAIALLLTRMDQIIIVAPVLLINFILCGQKKLYFKIVFFTFSLCYVPYIIWKFFYYGSVLPNTYYAKLAYKSFYLGGVTYIRIFLDIYPALVSVLFIVIGLCARNKKLRILSLLSLACFAAVVLYCIYIGGDFMEWRFIAPVAGIILIVGSMSFTGLIIDLTTQKRKYLPFIIYLVYLIFVSYHYYEGSLKSSFIVMPGQGQETIKSLAEYANPPYCWKEIGKSLKKYLPENTILATPAAGMIPFFYEGPVIDLHGLNNKKIARMSAEKSMSTVGHEIYVTSLEKMKGFGTQVVIDWPYLRIEKHHKYPDVDALRLTENKYVYLKILDPKVRDYLKKNWQHDMLPEEKNEGLDLCELKSNLPAHTPWDYYKCRIIQDVLKINFPQGLNKIYQIDLSLNCNNSYEITLLYGENTVHSFSVSPDSSQCPGMVNQTFYFNLQVPVSHALVKPTGSDGHYSIGSFIINKNEYCH